MTTSASSPAITPEFLQPLRDALSPSAQITFPSDPAFAAQTTSWNFDFKERPTVVLWMTCTADVVATIRFIRQHSLPFTVGCGFHSRYSMRNGHVLINLGGMRKVTVDPTAQLVRLQGGARNEDLDRACALHHMHTTAGTNPDTGCGGLVLGGGIGYLARRLGMAIDNLTDVELVNADGVVMRANERVNPDLFWACKGAGFNFGVVTEMTLRIHRVGHQLRELTADDEAIASKYGLPAQEELEHRVLQGFMPYPQPLYPQLMRVLDDQYVQPGAMGPMSDRDIFLALVCANGPHGPAAVVGFAYTGDVYKGYRALEQLVEDLGAPLAPVHAVVKPMTYVELQCAMDAMTPPGHYYERAFISQSAPPALAEANLKAVARATATPGLERCVIPMLVLGAGGALTDHLGNGCFAEDQRKGNWFVAAIGHYDPARTSRAVCLEWANATKDAILPHCTTHYTNSSNNQPGSRVIFSNSLARLREVKQKYDPRNAFCNNQNVVPASMQEDGVENAQARD